MGIFTGIVGIIIAFIAFENLVFIARVVGFVAIAWIIAGVIKELKNK